MVGVGEGKKVGCSTFVLGADQRLSGEGVFIETNHIPVNNTRCLAVLDSLLTLSVVNSDKIKKLILSYIAFD